MAKAALLLVKVMCVVFLFSLSETTLHAQVTRGVLSNEISTQELASYLKRYVQPSFDEWIAFGDAQDAYQDAFSRLHAEHLAEVLAEYRAMQRAGSVPSSEQIREMMDSMAKANKRIERLDSQLFDSIAALLPEDKLPGLERARLARHLHRLP